MMITWTTFILWYIYDMEMRLIIVHGFMNNVYHNSSCMITIDHCHERLLIMYHNCWSLPWKTVDHTWSLICITVDHVSQLLIMSMKHRWSYMINIDHCHESLLIMYHNCWSCIISWSLQEKATPRLATTFTSSISISITFKKVSTITIGVRSLGKSSFQVGKGRRGWATISIFISWPSHLFPLWHLFRHHGDLD